MDEATFTFPGADGMEIAAYRWSGDGEPKAVVQLAHGMGEHAARYRRLADARRSPNGGGQPGAVGGLGDRGRVS